MIYLIDQQVTTISNVKKQIRIVEKILIQISPFYDEINYPWNSNEREEINTVYLSKSNETDCASIHGKEKKKREMIKKGRRKEEGRKGEEAGR